MSRTASLTSCRHARNTESLQNGFPPNAFRSIASGCCQVSRGFNSVSHRHLFRKLLWACNPSAEVALLLPAGCRKHCGAFERFRKSKRSGPPAECLGMIRLCCAATRQLVRRSPGTSAKPLHSYIVHGLSARTFAAPCAGQRGRAGEARRGCSELRTGYCIRVLAHI
jgi:hypothetical protein